jgi:hemerythrin-like domain-containing protein
MLVEHDLGRLYVNNLVVALEKTKEGNEEAKLDVIANAVSYGELLQRHIDKEDKVIYNFAKRELKAEVMEVIDKECFDYENANTEVKDKNILILEKLENKYTHI